MFRVLGIYNFAKSFNFDLTYRKVASSRPVNYSIFEQFWGATNQGLLYRRAIIQFFELLGGATI